MRKILSYILTPIFYVVFGLVLVFFHPLQWIAIKLNMYKLHTWIVNFLNLFIIRSLNVLGTSITFEQSVDLPTDKPIIFVSNHQSMYDIPPLIWFLRKYQPKFVSKMSLGKGIPSISINLRKGGSVLIDRAKPLEAVEKLKNFGKYIEENIKSAVIFPEGTRSKNGEMKPLKEKGIKTILDYAPNALVVPITINNAYKLTGKGNFPLGVGSKVSLYVHKPIDRSLGLNEMIQQIEATIKSKLIFS